MFVGYEANAFFSFEPISQSKLEIQCSHQQLETCLIFFKKDP
jgi:hypothetical protein